MPDTFDPNEFASFKGASAKEGEVPAFDPNEFAAAKTAEQKPAAPTSHVAIPQNISDIPHEAYRTTMDTLGSIYQHLYANPMQRIEQRYKTDQSVGQRMLQGVKDVGSDVKDITSGLLDVGGLPFAPAMGAATSVVAHPYADIAGIPYDQARENFQGVAGKALAGMAPRGSSPVGARNITRPIPTYPELDAAADTNYQVARSFDIAVDPRASTQLADNIEHVLQRGHQGFQGGYRLLTAPQTFHLVEELRNPLNKPNPQEILMDDLESVRSALGKVRPEERDAANQARRMIDDFQANLQPADVLRGHRHLPAMRAELEEGRGNYAASKRIERVEDAEDRADRAAAASGSGANINNTTRQKMNTILNSPRLRRGFSPDELAQMRRIVNGTFTGNATRLLGKLAPTGIVSGAGSAGLGFLAHGLSGAAGLPIIGAVAKTIADASTARQLRLLGEQVRSRSPLYQNTPITPYPTNPYAVTGTAYGLGRQMEP